MHKSCLNCIHRCTCKWVPDVRKYPIPDPLPPLESNIDMSLIVDPWISNIYKTVAYGCKYFKEDK